LVHASWRSQPGSPGSGGASPYRAGVNAGSGGASPYRAGVNAGSGGASPYRAGVNAGSGGIYRKARRCFLCFFPAKATESEQLFSFARSTNLLNLTSRHHKRDALMNASDTNLG
jgi:hypothetical protein